MEISRLSTYFTGVGIVFLKVLLLALALGVFTRADAEPSRVWKLWDGKAPGDFTVSGPERWRIGKMARRPLPDMP